MTSESKDQPRVALGLDFGTESVRAVLVGLDGFEHASAVQNYRHGQIVERLPGSDNGSPRLPPHFALQYPVDWLESAASAIRQALSRAGIPGESIIGIGVDFTSCTMLPCRGDGTPLCLDEDLIDHPHAWPKLWKHHGAQPQTDDLNRVARERGEGWIARYGGAIGLEWLFPKMLEIFDSDRAAFEATEVFIEGGDWFVWRLVGGDAADIPRSTCQAGYKACWSPTEGYPSAAYLNAVRPEFGTEVLKRLPGRHLAPGQRAGVLAPDIATRFGLPAGIPVSAAVIDAHAGVPGAGVGGPDALVMVMGTSSCHMLCSEQERMVPGVAGIVRDGILPGYVGYELGQAAVGDAFDWLRRLTGRSLAELADEAALIPAGADGVLCVDWFNGCRTPLMDGSLCAMLQGLRLGTTPAHLYRAIAEATAFGVRWMVEMLREHDVPLRRFVATGGLPHASPLLVQIYADVLQEPIHVHPARHGPALGAAILGALAAGPEVTGFSSMVDAVTAMAPPTDAAIQPRPEVAAVYVDACRRYRASADFVATGAASRG